MEHIVLLLRFIVGFITKLCGIILTIIILGVIVIVCKLYDLVSLINNKTMPETLEDDDTEDTEDTE